MSRRRRLTLIAIAVAVVAAGGAAVVWLGDVSLPSAAALKGQGYLGALLLLYVEESGIPLLVPGDAFVLYVGHRLPDSLLPWIAAWLALIAAVTLGATNLYLICRTLGRRLLAHPLARFLHLSQARLDAAEQRFRRWGPWAVLIGRHVPGMRVPITVASGLLGMRYRLFAPASPCRPRSGRPCSWDWAPPSARKPAGCWASRPRASSSSPPESRRGSLPSDALARWRPGTGRRPLAWAALLAAQGLLLAADLGAGSRAALGVLAVIALLPAGWLLAGWRSALVLIAFMCARLVDYGLGGNTALTVVAELFAGAATMLAARAAMSAGWSARARLAREAAHDLRTPLTVLHGYISMLEDGSFPRERTHQVVTLLSGKTRELNEKIDAMLERMRVSA